MGKAEMVRHIAEETGLTQAMAAEVVGTIFNEIKRALQHGDSVILRGFGSFQVRDKPARIGRNPRTGQAAPISPRRVVLFKAGNRLKAAVNIPVSTPPEPQP
jgi:integration host factor subunit alpha